MKTLTKSNINTIRSTDLNNDYPFRFFCTKTKNIISVYKEHNVYNIKISHTDMIINPIAWSQMEKLHTPKVEKLHAVKEVLKQLVV